TLVRVGNALDLCLRMLRRVSRRRDEMPFALALIVELNWLNLKQRRELEALGSRHPTQSHDSLGQAVPNSPNVVDISKYLPERQVHTRLVKPAPAPPPTPPPDELHWARTALIVMAFVALALLPCLFFTSELSPNDYSTGIGEHRTIPLSDGSQITMNTQ